MSNNAQKAEALRALADILESGELPAERYDDQPINILAIYDDEASRDRAAEVMISRGHSVGKRGKDDFEANMGADGEYYPGVTFGMVTAKIAGGEDADA